MRKSVLTPTPKLGPSKLAWYSWTRQKLGQGTATNWEVEIAWSWAWMQLSGMEGLISGATTVAGYSRLWNGILGWTRETTNLGVVAKKAAEPLNLAGGSASAYLPLQDSKTENLDRAHSMDLSQLEPDTSYCARVRVKPISNYDGIWSKWSEEYTWKTDWGMSLGHHHTPGTT